jgi:hypothetical protein
VLRLCTGFRFPLLFFISLDDPDVARLYTLMPSMPYDVECYEAAFLEWITVTGFIYDEDRRVRFTAPEEVWSEADDTIVGVKFPAMMVKEGLVDVELVKWHSTIEDDLKGSRKSFLLF